MNKLLPTLLMLCITSTSFGQWWSMATDINFEDSLSLEQVIIDTNSNSNNIWQIGPPQKTVFTTANSAPNVIVTDTINTYPTNDTSSFLIGILDQGGYSYSHTAVISGWYNVDSDYLNDYGLLELSLDNGNTWLDLINDTAIASNLMWMTAKPTFTGSSIGWQQFSVNAGLLGLIYNINLYDTTWYRFTFISDSVQTNKNGLMFDSFHVENWAESVEEFQDNSLISIYPSPTSDKLTVKREKSSQNESVEIYNAYGQIIYQARDFTSDFIDTGTYKNGLYFLKYKDGNSFAVKKFVVHHSAK